ncbi:MAG: LptF/LptG family permease [candidate division Zixibacteria bacterium]|nr:LptF/LptG family permease [candidate division Zixibacteria bacterium]
MPVIYRYILKEHIGPFFFGLATITFVLIMDFLLELLNLIIGKGVGFLVVLQAFALNLAWMLALSIPMAVFVSTLMAFGRLSQDNEITALKTSGVSLYRIIFFPLLFSFVLALGLIIFNDRVLPEANHKARILMSEIHQKKPTLSIKENLFMDEIPGYHLLVKKVNPKTNEISGITIYEKREGLFPRTILARKGKIEFSEDKNTLIFYLENGEVHEADQNQPGHYRFISFEKQTLYIPDVGNRLMQTGDDYRTDREMDIGMMMNKVKRIQENISTGKRELARSAEQSISEVFKNNTSTKKASEGEDKLLSDIFFTNQRQFFKLQMETQNLSYQERVKNSYLVEVHKKYSLPFACVVFILIGAPLGIMARRGNMAVGLGMSLGFFLLYWAFLIGGEELADRMYVPAFWAMWSANILLALAGVYILIKSSRETTFISWKWTEKFIPKRFRKFMFGIES